MITGGQYICLISVPLLLGATGAAAQVPAPPAEEPAAKTVVIVGKKRGITIDQATPRFSLKPAAIQAYGADSIEDLLSILKPQTRSPEGKPPVVLLNGHRVSGFSILKDIPPEAVARIDSFSEATALAYGYPPGQMVLNIVLVADYRGRAAEAAQTDAFADVGTKSNLKYSHLHIGGTGRVNVSANYDAAQHILESERDVTTTVGQTDLASTRTLVPDSHHIEASLSLSRTLFDQIEVTLDGSINGARRNSQLGLASGSLTVPSSNPFSPSGTATQIDRYFPEAGALRQASSDWNSHGGLSVNGPFKTWQWSLIASADRMISHTFTENGLDLSTTQAALDRNDSEIDPFKSLASVIKTFSDQSSISDQYMLMAMTSGAVAQLPAGPLNLSVNLTGNRSHVSTQTSAMGTRQPDRFDQAGLTSQISLFVPISQSGKSLLPGLGTFSLNAGLSATKASDFKETTGFSYGFQWMPVGRLLVSANRSRSEMAPPAQSLTSSVIDTPNIVIFDYVRGENAIVTQSAGGNAGLPVSRMDTTNIDFFITPSPKIDLSISVGANLSLTSDGAGILPPPTQEAERAFPDRYRRDLAGRLVWIDARLISYARQQSDQTHASVNYTCILTTCRWLKIFRMSDSRLSVSINQSQRLSDTVVIRAGLPEIDRLKGGITQTGAPQPPSQLEWNIGLTSPLGGVWFSGRWLAATQARGGDAESNLSFSSATVANLRIFTNLGRLKQTASKPWAQGLRLTFSVDNLFDSYQAVADENGHTPALYQRGLIDPMGRTITTSIRKNF